LMTFLLLRKIKANARPIQANKRIAPVQAS
jgi:hypothetical protein